MRVLMRVDCGQQHGLGHSTRMLALAHALAARGCEVRFITRSQALADFVAPFAHETSLDAIGEHRLLAEAVARWTPEVLVLDHPYPYGDDVLSELDATWCHVVRIDHPDATVATCSLLVAPSVHWDPVTIARLETVFGPRFLHGWDYVMLDEAVTNQPAVTYAERQDGPIVFCAGGSDPGGALGSMFAWTAASPVLWRWRKLYAFGAQAQGWQASASRDACYRVVPFERTWLRQAALVVTMLGQTAYECLWYGTPTLCFARTLDDVARLEVLSDATDGGLVACGVFEHATPAWFCGLVQRYWKDAAHRASMAAADAGKMDGRGVQRVADAIVALGAP